MDPGAPLEVLHPPGATRSVLTSTAHKDAWHLPLLFRPYAECNGPLRNTLKCLYNFAFESNQLLNELAKYSFMINQAISPTIMDIHEFL